MLFWKSPFQTARLACCCSKPRLPRFQAHRDEVWRDPRKSYHPNTFVDGMTGRLGHFFCVFPVLFSSWFNGKPRNLQDDVVFQTGWWFSNIVNSLANFHLHPPQFSPRTPPPPPILTNMFEMGWTSCPPVSCWVMCVFQFCWQIALVGCIKICHCRYFEWIYSQRRRTAACGWGRSTLVPCRRRWSSTQ